MKTLRIRLKSLRNEEWFNLHFDLKAMVERYTPNAIGLKDLFDSFLPLYSKADEVLQTIRKSVYTLDMEGADKKRVDIFTGFFGVVKSSKKQPDAAKSRAAIKVFNVLNGYKKAIRGSYAERSSTIYNLLQDLSGAYAADVTLLGFTDWVTSLRSAEDEFMAARGERQDESFAKPKEKLLPIRNEVDTVYSAMLDVLDARLLAAGLGKDVVVNPKDLDTEIHEDGVQFSPETHGNISYNFVVDWNEMLKKYRNLLQQRAGRSKEKEEEDNGDSGPVED
ncbi:MAG: DUF6261 family protein [Tannerellaceae bacterium]|jgi:hypothetical protein|nr:DUF6261 family protein [Tannerellaceae bacterium]